MTLLLLSHSMSLGLPAELMKTFIVHPSFSTCQSQNSSPSYIQRSSSEMECFTGQVKFFQQPYEIRSFILDHTVAILDLKQSLQLRSVSSKNDQTSNLTVGFTNDNLC